MTFATAAEHGGTVPCRRLVQRRGIGALTASAFVAELGDHRAFRNGSQVGAWLGLVPAAHRSARMAGSGTALRHERGAAPRCWCARVIPHSVRRSLRQSLVRVVPPTGQIHGEVAGSA